VRSQKEENVQLRLQTSQRPVRLADKSWLKVLLADLLWKKILYHSW